MPKRKIIIYALLYNNGGLKRVAESFAAYKDDSVHFFIFGRKKPTGVLRPGTTWIPLPDFIDLEKGRPIEKVRSAILSSIPDPSQVLCIIGDYLTLPYFEFLNKPTVYDVHILEKVLSYKLGENPRYKLLDQFTTHPLCMLATIFGPKCMIREARWMHRSSAIVVNSKTPRNI